MSHVEAKKIVEEREKQLVDGIELFDGIILRLISKEDIKLLQPKLYFTPSFKLPINIFVLEKILSIDDRFETSKVMFDIVLALRLLHEGYVSDGEAIYFKATEKGDFRYSGSAFSKSPRKQEHKGTYPLYFEDFSPLKDLIHRIRQAKIEKRKHFHLAVKRFNRSYETPDIDDKLLDLIIAFEILFLKGEDFKRSKRSKISIVCSKFLGKSNKNKKEIQEILDKSYHIRNCIVHGSEYEEEQIIGDKKFTIYELIEKVEYYLRESIKKLL